MASARIDGYSTVVDLDIESEGEGESTDAVEYVIDSDCPVRNDAEIDAICDNLKEYLHGGIIPVVAIFVPNR